MKICVIGGGVAGLTFVKKLKKMGFKGKVSVVDKRRCSFARKDIFSLLREKDGEIIDLKKISRKEEFNFIHKEVAKLVPSKKKVVFKDGSSEEFDIIVVASGLSSKDLASLKGKNYEGVFFLSQIDPLSLKDYLKMSKELAVIAFTFLGIKLCFSLSFLKDKEIRIFFPLPSFIKRKEKVIEILEKRGIKIHFDNIIEIIGEKYVKAIKTEKGKFYSSHCVFIDSGFTSNDRFFDSSDNFSSLNVYFIGDVKNKNVEKQYLFFKNNLFCKKEAQEFAFYFKKKIMEAEVVR